jgi:spore maturation protein CgeB
MRIFTAVRHSNNPQKFYGALWSGNFYPALQQLGHEMIESQVDLLPASRFMQIANNFTPQELEVRAQITQKIIDEVKEAHRQKPIDIFLSYFYNSHFDPAGFAEINALGIPTVNFYCNSIYQFQLVSEIAAKVNYSWHAEKDARSLYLKAGANPIWVQMGADPEVYRPVSGISRQRKACFVGQRYADRDRWMAALVRAEIPVEIYGPGWGETQSSATNKSTNKSTNQSTNNPQPEEYLGRKQVVPGNAASYLQVVFNNIKTQGVWGGLVRNWQQIQYRQETKKLSPLFPPFAKGAIPFQQICSVFSGYEVILNFSNVWADGTSGSSLIPHVRLRDFEAPMSRTCYLTGYTEEITNFYQLGKEIDTYSSAEELVDKTKFYLNNPAEAEKLRDAGYQRALRDHTWKRRFEQLFASIDLLN